MIDPQPAGARRPSRAGTHGRETGATERLFGRALAAVGLAGLVAAAELRPEAARSAAAQDWPPFVLVTGLLLIGLAAHDDGLFAAAGHRLARGAPRAAVLYLGAVVMVGSVTAVLNLDTSVAFLTPVLVYAARSRGDDDAPLLYGCLLFANAGSLFLPGSNLTNLIVLGHLHLTGGQFLAQMWAPALASLVVTAIVVGGVEHRSLRTRVTDVTPAPRPVLGLGLVAVLGAAVLVVTLHNAAIPVAAIGVSVIAIRVVRGRKPPGQVTEVLGVPTLLGLFGVAVALGTLGRAWSGPARLLAHLDGWATAAVAAGSSVLVNNLPAASLLAARRPDHPFSLLVGLNLGPNLFVTGSLAWLLWLRAARSAGARPSIGRAARLGIMAVPASMAAALGALTISAWR